MTHERLIRYRNGGPNTRVHRDTRARILQGGAQWSPIGIQRRLQALTALGWSMRIVADQSRVDMDALKRLRRRPHIQFVRREFAEAIIATYDRLHMTPAPPGRSSGRTMFDAKDNNWLTPMHWDDIDFGEAHNNITVDDYDIDPIVISRILNGENVAATRPERAEVCRQWVARGRALNDLERVTGWRVYRYFHLGDVA